MAIALRAHNLGDSAASATSQSVSITSTTLGDLATVVASVGGNTTISVADNGASHATWVTLLAATYDATLDRTRAVFAAYNIPASITAVTVTYGASSANRGTQVATWSGVASSAAFDKGPGSQTQTSTTPTSLSVTPSQDNELVLGVGLATGSALSSAAGFTTIDGGTTASFLKTQQKVQTTATAVTASYTCSSEYVVCDVFTFATSPVGGSTLVSASDTATLTETGVVNGNATIVGTDTATLVDTPHLNAQVIGRDLGSVVDFATSLTVIDPLVPEATVSETAQIVATLATQVDAFSLSETAAVSVNATFVSASDAFGVTDVAGALTGTLTGRDALALAERGSVLTVGGLTVSAGDTFSMTETAIITILSQRYALGSLTLGPRLQGSETLTPRLGGELDMHP